MHEAEEVRRCFYKIAAPPHEREHAPRTPIKLQLLLDGQAGGRPAAPAARAVDQVGVGRREHRARRRRAAAALARLLLFWFFLFVVWVCDV